MLKFGRLQWICIANGSVTIHWATVLLKQKVASMFGNSSYMGEKGCWDISFLWNGSRQSMGHTAVCRRRKKCVKASLSVAWVIKTYVNMPSHKPYLSYLYRGINSNASVFPEQQWCRCCLSKYYTLCYVCPLSLWIIEDKRPIKSNSLWPLLGNINKIPDPLTQDGKAI